ncbi:ATP-binding protein [Bacillus sp. DTU_2020_1000418_1_SI_GHA_SEK_038]|uniref:ATP-binding protein n=1 Tax=Bacillus sp. DTU_2020_1000418_1_SI_GHA_SEK_038 TaxID=3077585 RepID=UPI0028EC5390|nr:ATP-binding protein [Bacillus sp. DTU_2020_1000418_1_SI_GHA_SEK_038]WNS73683.1 ATP-binding protein [Bacillus sp. DTU_2020_1000418_1_SI_GHA_SEK_038]
MITEVVQPNISNFIKSLRDIGYTFEVAVADVLDNSITAKAKNVHISCMPNPSTVFTLLDDGTGMSNSELIDAMRLATNDPDSPREGVDLGKFGLGLKTASFSQCIDLTVLSKKNGVVSIKQWDLKFISRENEWLLITPDISEYTNVPLFEEFMQQENGTLVVWRGIDTFKEADIPNKLDILRSHLSLVFHCFLEGIVPGKNALKIFVNGQSLEPFNPFNPKHIATQQLVPEKIKYLNSEIIVQPYILPHHSKLSQQEFDKYATKDGYTKSQGFYLYRAHRLLIHGTWWGMHRTNDAHKLVRIKIDIPNNQDTAWGIDIKKSAANPVSEIKKDLKRIIQQVTVKGSRPFTGRGKKIEDKTTTRFWELVADNKDIHFAINREHPIIKNLEDTLREDQHQLLNVILMGLESYLPLDAIVAQLNTNPLKVKQETLINENEIIMLVENWRSKGVSEAFIKELLKTEVYKNKEGYFENASQH